MTCWCMSLPSGSVDRAVHPAGGRLQEAGRVVAQRRGEQAERQRGAGDAAEPARRGGQDQPADPVRVAQGQLLGDAAAEGDAEHVGVGQAEGVEEVGGLAGEAVWPQRDEPGRRVPGPGRVVGDGLEAPGVELALQRVPHLDVAAQPHDQQDRRAVAAGRTPAAGARRRGRRCAGPGIHRWT